MSLPEALAAFLAIWGSAQYFFTIANSLKDL
jgi:hypothetical protein